MLQVDSQSDWNMVESIRERCEGYHRFISEQEREQSYRRVDWAAVTTKGIHLLQVDTRWTDWKMPRISQLVEYVQLLHS
jgi:hypothetical protein